MNLEAAFTVLIALVGVASGVSVFLAIREGLISRAKRKGSDERRQPVGRPTAQTQNQSARLLSTRDPGRSVPHLAASENGTSTELVDLRLQPR